MEAEPDRHLRRRRSRARHLRHDAHQAAARRCGRTAGPRSGSPRRRAAAARPRWRSTSPSASPTSPTCGRCWSISTCAGRRWRSELGADGAALGGARAAGQATIAETFVRYGDNLAIGTNSEPRAQFGRPPDERRDRRRRVAGLKAAFPPDVIIYDLPPMLKSDDVMAFLPHLDCVLLVAGAEKSRLDEVDKCEQRSRRARPTCSASCSTCAATWARTTATTEAGRRGGGAR